MRFFQLCVVCVLLTACADDSVDLADSGADAAVAAPDASPYPRYRVGFSVNNLEQGCADAPVQGMPFFIEFRPNGDMLWLPATGDGAGQVSDTFVAIAGDTVTVSASRVDSYVGDDGAEDFDAFTFTVDGAGHFATTVRATRVGSAQAGCVNTYGLVGDLVQ